MSPPRTGRLSTPMPKAIPESKAWSLFTDFRSAGLSSIDFSPTRSCPTIFISFATTCVDMAAAVSLTARRHTNRLVMRRISPPYPPFYVGWSLGASIIADIIANIDPIPIAGAVALSGSPSVSEDILPNIASDLLQTLFPEFVENDNVTLGL
ncbi:hypothetical protein HGRIS_011735 [Hohenbuehelia grisea]|uniref:Uncharacterized protein n=1 Tax=Hohenbuehelia grisea TaxID=104357 RepID=A0ABR3JW64_9AGAR